MKDPAFYETGSGGDMSLLNNDIVLSSGLFNQVYFALFGGNPKQSTTQDIITPREDWWANELFLSSYPALQYNSQTERTLTEVALNSSGRAAIERAITQDLQYLQLPYTLDVSITSTNKVEIHIKMNESMANETYRFIWDATRSELIETQLI